MERDSFVQFHAQTLKFFPRFVKRKPENMSSSFQRIISAVTTKGPYKRGRKDQMTPMWKELVRTRMDELGISHAALEKRIKAGSGTISHMLSERQNTSVWVAKVAEALQLPPPGRESEDEALLLENFRRATPEGRRALLQHAAAAAGIAPPKSN
jgi:antitoxin component HigA of HigAB toxin-antitoxin module